MPDDIERSIRALPHDMQDRMARLVLGGWTIEPVHTPVTSLGWRAKHPNVWKKMYVATTLLTLLYQMDGVVEDTEAGVYQFHEYDVRYSGDARPVPDAASPTGRNPSHPEIQNLPSR